MFIEKIKIDKFKSIYDPLTINFQEIKGLWKISGNVGAGKTTLGEAIIFGLFGSVNGKNNGDLISWGYKKGQVELWCRSKGRSIYIKREMKAYGQSPVYVEIDGEELIFTNKRNAQNQLETEYYDTSRTTLELLCIISFNNFKSLATLNTSDTKKFLDHVLGFYTLTHYSEVCKDLKNECYQEQMKSERNIENLNSQIDKLQQLSNVSIIEGSLEETNKEIEILKDKLAEVARVYTDKINIEKDKKSEYEQQKASITALGKEKAKEISFIEKGTCPTCGAKIDQSKLEIKKKEKEELGKQYTNVVDLIKICNEYIENYKEAYKNEIADDKKRLDELTAKSIELRAQQNRITINEDEISNIETQVKTEQDSLNGLEAEYNQWDNLYDILSVEIRAKILSSFIPVLNKKIMKYTSRLHLPYLVQFDNQFSCHITIIGLNQEVPISSLSTGQLKTVDMVIILGVLGTVMGSNNLNIMFLDELFSNLDASLRNDMCMVLKEAVAPDQSMFIISHTDLDNRFFEGTIEMKQVVKNKFEKHSIATVWTNHNI